MFNQAFCANWLNKYCRILINFSLASLTRDAGH